MLVAATSRTRPDPFVIGAGLLGGLVAGNLTQLGQTTIVFNSVLLHDRTGFGVGVLVVAALLPAVLPALRRFGWFVAAAGTLIIILSPPLPTELDQIGGPPLLGGPIRMTALIAAAAIGLILGGALLSAGTGTAAERIGVVGGLVVGFVAGASQSIAALALAGIERAYPFGASFVLFVAAGVVVALRRPRPSTLDSSVGAGWLDLAVMVGLGALVSFVTIFPRYAQADPPGIFLVPRWWSAGLWWVAGGLIVLVLFVVAMARAGSAGGRWVIAGAALAASAQSLLGFGPLSARNPARDGLQALDLAVVAVAAGLGILAMWLAGRVPWDAIGLMLLAVPLFAVVRFQTDFFGPGGRAPVTTVVGSIAFATAGFALAAAATRLVRLAARPGLRAGVWRCVGLGMAAAILTDQAIFQPVISTNRVHPDPLDVLTPWGLCVIAGVLIVLLGFIPDRKPITLSG
jgi:hypothetical protein